MDIEGLSSVCGGLGCRREDKDGILLRYEKGEYCLDNLKDLQRFLRRDDPQSREVFKQICKWNVVSRELIPLMENHHTDRNLVINGVKVLVFLTMPVDSASENIAQQIEHLWHIKAAITRRVIVGVVVALLEDPLDHLERNTFTEDDWMLVQLVLTLFRNVLAIQDILSQHKASGSSSHCLHLRDAFLEILFQENVMDLVLVLTQSINCSSHLRKDGMLFLEIFHYIFQGHEPNQVADSSQKQFEDAVIETSVNSLRGIMEEEQKRARLLKLRNSAISSRFNGTFTRLTVDGSRTLLKGNPTASGKNLLQMPQVQRGPLKKIMWDKSLPPANKKISSLLCNFLDQFLNGAYNVLMQSVIKDIEKDEHEVQTCDIIMFYHVACFVTEFHHHRVSIVNRELSARHPEFPEDKDDRKSTSYGDICGPVAATLHETVFSLVISKWRYAFETLKETSNYKLLSASSAIMKSMIRMLDLVLKVSPEDSKEHRTARVILYKLFYDQTDQGTTQFLLSLIKSFDAHKQPKSDLADLVELIYRFLKLMENLQQNGPLRVSKKRRKGRKKKASSGNGSAEEVKQPDDSLLADDAQLDAVMLCPVDDPPPAKDLDAQHLDEPNTESDPDILPHSKASGDAAGEQNYVTEDSEDEHQPEMNEVDFCASNILIHIANNSIIQRLCWLLKFYHSSTPDVNYYVINLLQRISDDLELSPMLYQLSLLTIFYGILVERESSKCSEDQIVFDFLTKLVRRMFKKLKNQPLLFVELLLWKTRKECHYIDAESLLNDIHNLRKDAKSSEPGGEEISASGTAWRHSRSIADSLGDDEADAIIPDNLYRHNGKTADGSPTGADDEASGSLSPRGAIGLNTAPSHGRKRIRAFSEEQEQILRNLFEEFKDHRRCAHMIANALGPGAYSAAQVSRKLRQLGLRLPRKQKPSKGPVEEEKTVDSGEDEVMLATLLKRCKKSKDRREEAETGVDASSEREFLSSEPSTNFHSTHDTSPEEKQREEEKLESGPSAGTDDELADSGDELSFVNTRNIVSRRKLWTVVDGDADD